MKPIWMEKKETFRIEDVQKLKGNFLPSILKNAKGVKEGDGLCIIQSFEPIPLYSALNELGFEHYTEKVSDTEYRAYFYRVSIVSSKTSNSNKSALKPTAIVNFNHINPKLADVIVDFWDLIWGQENPAIDTKTMLLLSLANGVGAGRLKQATRELIKAYSIGVTVLELDELFSMFSWNQGIGHFASEIGPSSLFKAYQLIKTKENRGVERSEIVKVLVEKYGDEIS